MAKPKLTTLTEKWIAGKTGGEPLAKPGRPNLSSSERKTRRTFYISNDAVKLLWHNRAETGESLSNAVEKLIFTHFKKTPQAPAQGR